jgi:flagellin-like hook-associated protein FlgL
MIGPMSSSLALAQRTASKARANMDAMSRQIATGQKVSSVKDDGAAWTRANTFKSQKTDWVTREQVLTMVEIDLNATHDAATSQQKVLEDLQQILISARASSIGSSTRAALKAQWDLTIQSASLPAGTTPVFENATYVVNGWDSGIDLSASDSFLSSGGRYMVHPNLASLNYTNIVNGTTVPVALASINLNTATSTDLDNAQASLDTLMGNLPSGGTYLHLRITESARDLDRVASMKQQASLFTDRLDTAIGSLTDADLSAASTQLRQSEARQQLALDVIKTALTAYGNYAGGLLGNVQRTQRGVLA